MNGASHRCLILIVIFMKKGIFLALGAAFTVAGILEVNKLNSEELASNDLLMENVEALSNGEIGSGAFVPCYAAKNRICSYNAHMADGQNVVMKVQEAEKAAPFA